MIKYYKLELHQEEVSSGVFGPKNLNKVNASKLYGNTQIAEIAINKLSIKSTIVEKARYNVDGTKLKKNVDTDVFIFEEEIRNCKTVTFNKKVLDLISHFCDENTTILKVDNLYVESKNPTETHENIYMLIQSEISIKEFLDFENSDFILKDLDTRETQDHKFNLSSFSEFLNLGYEVTKKQINTNKLIMNEAPHIFVSAEIFQTRRILYSEHVLDAMKGAGVTGFHVREMPIFAKKIQDKKYGL